MRIPHVLVCYKFDDETHPATTTTLGNVKKSRQLVLPQSAKYVAEYQRESKSTKVAFSSIRRGI